jgi:DNA-binding NtrC family response regulator
MIPYVISVIDDEAVVRDGLRLALGKKGYAVQLYDCAEAALEDIESHPPDLVLLDIGLPGMNGVEALREIKTRCQDAIVVMITAYEDVNTVVNAMKFGAHEYLVKPVQMDALFGMLETIFESIALRKEIQLLHEKYLNDNLPCIIGESRAIQDVMEVVARVSGSPDTTILIQGKTGTGKELIAKAIHYRSPNFKGPFVEVNCAAIPKELIESELFGYEKGAFSGADPAGKAGLVETAHHGTLFLDEIGDLGREAQSKLLRFLESGEYYKVGGTRKYSISTRVVSATNKNLRALIEKGRFRQDLYFRLAVVNIEIPSLNRRREDIVPIARHFLVAFNRKLGKSFTRLALSAEAALTDHQWTGNVRELKNIIERGVLMGDGSELTLSHLGLNARSAEPSPVRDGISTDLPAFTAEGIDFPELIRSIEDSYLRNALEAAGGNECRAAQMLNLSRDQFRYRRRKLAIQ